MKRIARQFTYPTALVVAVVLLAFMVFASPSLSRAASPEPGMAKAVHVEARIKELHAKLKITPEQEKQWDVVTQAMRDNAKTMDELIKARTEKAKTMTAIEDLKSYGEIVQAHADGIRKFIAAFDPLYAGMSDAQQKEADKLFQYHDRTKSKAKAK